MTKFKSNNIVVDSKTGTKSIDNRFEALFRNGEKMGFVLKNNKVVFLQMKEDGTPLCDYQGNPHLYSSYEEANINGRAREGVLSWLEFHK